MKLYPSKKTEGVYWLIYHLQAKAWEISVDKAILHDGMVPWDQIGNVTVDYEFLPDDIKSSIRHTMKLNGDIYCPDCQVDFSICQCE